MSQGACSNLTVDGLQRFFAEVGSRISQAKPVDGLADTSALKPFFFHAGERLRLAAETRRQRDRIDATRFNVFHLIDPDENKLSDIIADLLSPNGTHGQADLFLSLFLKQIGLTLSTKGISSMIVQREAPTHGIAKYRRRIDVLLEGEMTIAIENKVDALEQAEQVKDYLDHLAYCTHNRGGRYTLIYLTPDGRRPESVDVTTAKAAQAAGRLLCWSYRRELRKWLEACHRECAARKIQEFLSDFMGYNEAKMQRAAEPKYAEDHDQ